MTSNLRSVTERLGTYIWAIVQARRISSVFISHRWRENSSATGGHKCSLVLLHGVSDSSNQVARGSRDFTQAQQWPPEWSIHAWNSIIICRVTIKMTIFFISYFHFNPFAFSFSHFRTISIWCFQRSYSWSLSKIFAFFVRFDRVRYHLVVVYLVLCLPHFLVLIWDRYQKSRISGY